MVFWNSLQIHVIENYQPKVFLFLSEMIIFFFFYPDVTFHTVNILFILFLISYTNILTLLNPAFNNERTEGSSFSGALKFKNKGKYYTDTLFNKT